MSDVLFSRSASPDPAGKCVVEVKILLPESVAEDFQGVAWAARSSVSEYGRAVIKQHLYGKVTRLRSKHDQLEEGMPE